MRDCPVRDKRAKPRTAKESRVRIRIVALETVYSVIRRRLVTLDAAIAKYQRGKSSKATIDAAYDEFREAMRKLGLSGK